MVGIAAFSLMLTVGPALHAKFPAPLSDGVFLIAVLIVTQAAFDWIARVGIRSEPILWDERHTLFRWPLFWFVAIAFLAISLVELFAHIPISYNGSPYDGPRWVFLAMPLLALPAMAMTMGVRLRVTASSLLLRSAVWPTTRIPLGQVASVQNQVARGNSWLMGAGTYWRLGGIIPLMPRDFTAAGAGVLRVKLVTGKVYLVAAKNVEALREAIESRRPGAMPN